MQVAKVDLWTVQLTSPCPMHLSEDEIVRANRFVFEEDRLRWSRARSSLRLILSRYAGVGASELRFQYGEHGKPSLSAPAELQFNLSHSGDWAMIAVTQSIPVGVDIERIRPKVEMGSLLRRLRETELPDSIPDLYQVWTRREARSKAAGGALFDTPRANIFAIDVSAPAGYAASVATLESAPVVSHQRLY